MRLVVLVVDDDREFRETVARFLEAAGYSVDRAEDGRHAIALAAAGKYDLILIKLEMPDVDGLATTRSIRARDLQLSRPAVPIIGFTTQELTGVRTGCLAAGMSDCVVKPASRPSVLTLAARWTTARSGRFDRAFADLIPSYLAARRADVSTMEALLANGDYAGIRAIAHRMRGTGGTYGMPQLTLLGAGIEAAADAKDWSGLEELLRALDVELKKITLPRSGASESIPQETNA